MHGRPDETEPTVAEVEHDFEMPEDSDLTADVDDDDDADDAEP